jgi:hypothetical protein
MAQIMMAQGMMAQAMAKLTATSMPSFNCATALPRASQSVRKRTFRVFAIEHLHASECFTTYTGRLVKLLNLYINNML